MTDPDQFEPLRRALKAWSSGSTVNEPTSECLDENTIGALADGSLDPAARAATLPHLANCARCRMAVVSVARALGDSAVARETAALTGAGRRRFYRIAFPAAAAAVLLLLAWPRQVGDLPPVHRAPTITAAAAPTAMSPVGAVAEPDALVWGAVAGADRYRVTLFDAGSRVVYETELADTVAALPDSVVLVPGQPYLWKVEARTGWDRWSASELVQFRVAGSAPR